MQKCRLECGRFLSAYRIAGVVAAVVVGFVDAVVAAAAVGVVGFVVVAY